jgi:hypothetical protein
MSEALEGAGSVGVFVWAIVAIIVLAEEFVTTEEVHPCWKGVLVLAFCTIPALLPFQEGSRFKPADPRFDPAIWGEGYGIGGPPPDPRFRPPPPLVPDHWLVVPEKDRADPESILRRWILDPRSSPPVGVDDPSRVDVAADRWLMRRDSDAGESTCAFTTIRSAIAEVRMARLTGAEWMLVNGVPVGGDPERRGVRGFPVPLIAGENRIFVASGGACFDFELWKPSTRLAFEAFDIGWPGDGDVTYPILNTSLETVRYVHVHYGHAVRPTEGCCPELSDWRDGGHIAPLAMMLGGSYYDDIVGCGPVNPAARDVLVPICVYANEGELADRRLLRRQPDEAGRQPNNFESVGRHPRKESLAHARLLSLPGTCVYPSVGSSEETEIGLEASRFHQQLAWYVHGGIPLVLSDVDFLQADNERPNSWLGWKLAGGWGVDDVSVVLRGNADTNSAWPEIVYDSLRIEVRRGRVSFRGHEEEGDDLAGWFWTSRNKVVLFDTGCRGARLLEDMMLSFEGDIEEPSLFRVDPNAVNGWLRIPVPKAD